MTRTHQKHVRVYVDGVDYSGYARQVSPLTWTYGADADAALTDGAKNVIVGKGEIKLDALNAFFDNDAAGPFVNLSDAATRDVLVAIGVKAPPAAGDPVFAWTFEQKSYIAEPGAGFVVATLALEASFAAKLTYQRPWGFLAHAKGAEAAVNTATGLDDYGGATALGGLFVYHLISANGTVTVKLQDAATNLDASFADLSGATSGVKSAPAHGFVALSPTATVRRYTRWQLLFGTATTCTFVLGFIRSNS